MHILVTGSSGLIGSEAVRFFDKLGARVTGIDNNMRREFFGPAGDTAPVLAQLRAQCRQFQHIGLDIRNRAGVAELLRRQHFDVIIHAAAQPSHDLAARRPLDDFDVNAGGTLNLLEACRRHAPEAVFCHMSTNKVYGDGVNRLELIERESRYDFADPAHVLGIDETFPIDRCLHSPFGASKCAADLMVQEYGRYYGLKTGVFRGGCLTGPRHAGVELHGFLSHLVKTAVRGEPYTIYGYKGKQVRDQMHAGDVVSALWAFAQEPRAGAVYNIGGGKENSASVLESIEMIAEITDRRPQVSYDAQHRLGDHICYYTDMARFRRDYPDWRMRCDLPSILQEMVEQEIGAVSEVA